jgi:hypothetical protein
MDGNTMLLRVNTMSVWLWLTGVACVLAYIFVLHKLVKHLDSDVDSIRADMAKLRGETHALSLKIGELLLLRAPAAFAQEEAVEPGKEPEEPEPEQASEKNKTAIDAI